MLKTKKEDLDTYETTVEIERVPTAVTVFYERNGLHVEIYETLTPAGDEVVLPADEEIGVKGSIIQRDLQPG